MSESGYSSDEDCFYREELIRLKKSYRVKALLRKAAHGDIFLGSDRQRRQVILKVIKKRKGSITYHNGRRIPTEAKMHYLARAADPKGTVALLDVFERTADFVLAMEKPDNSIDFIFSQAVLEHVNLHDFKELLDQTKRVLNKNGICSHRVDLGDHLGGKLNNLRFSEKLWESNFFKKSGFYTNRLRCSEIINLCNKVGFRVKEIEKRRWFKPVINSSKLNYKFQKFSENELLISGFDILLEHN